MTEGRDWARTQFEACPDCGANAAAIVDDELGPALVREVAAWGRTLATADPARVRVRPGPGVWSALEYAAHVRDLLPVMAQRIRRIREEDDPVLGWWDHQAAVIDDRYNEQDPVLVLEALGANARAFVATLREVEADEWARGGQRRPGERFTIRGMARFVLHETIHHRDDAERALRRADPEPPPSVSPR